jgi:glyoxylase-like metal-dependent hydrolase (beta-lactamase superfamily II)
MKQKSVGNITVSRVVELEGTEFRWQGLFPALKQADFDAHRDWLAPHFFDYASGNTRFSFHAFVVRTEKHTIVVDTCIGNHKNRHARPIFNMRDDGRFLGELAAANVRPEEVDYVMCTHLHGDHVGWNTRLENGRWVPTFPNAKYLFSRKELEYFSAIPEDDGNHWQGYRDSVLPVIEAGNAVTVEADHALDDTVWLEPSHGHTPGHCSVRLKSNGAEAVMSGDLLHHPIQCAMPHVSSAACIDPEQSAATRREFLARYADTAVKVFPAHFAPPTAGFVVSKGDQYRWKPDA